MFVNDLIRKAEFKGISLWSSSQLFLDLLVFISLWLDHWQINTSLDKLLNLESGHTSTLEAFGALMKMRHSFSKIACKERCK